MKIELIKVVDILVKSRLNQSDLNSIVYRLVDAVAISTLSKTFLLIEIHQHIKQVQQSIDKPNTMNELITPKEKALELYLKFQKSTLNAMLCVEVIRKETGCNNCKEIDSHYWDNVLIELDYIKKIVL